MSCENRPVCHRMQSILVSSGKEAKAKLNMRLYKTNKQEAFAQFRKLLTKLNAAYLVGEDIFK